MRKFKVGDIVSVPFGYGPAKYAVIESLKTAKYPHHASVRLIEMHDDTHYWIVPTVSLKLCNDLTMFEKIMYNLPTYRPT